MEQVVIGGLAWAIQLASEYYILKALGAGISIGVPVWMKKSTGWDWPVVIFAGVIMLASIMFINDHLLDWAAAHEKKNVETTVREWLDKEGYSTRPLELKSDEKFHLGVSNSKMHLEFDVLHSSTTPDALILASTITPSSTRFEQLTERERRRLFLEIRQGLISLGLLFVYDENNPTIILSDRVSLDKLTKDLFMSKVIHFTYGKALIDVLFQKALDGHVEGSKTAI